MQDKSNTIRTIVALRMARASLGWSQEELASQLGIAKTTLARFETMDGGLSADQLTRLIKHYHAHGVEIDFMTTDDVKVSASPQATSHALARLENDSLRRSDRRKVRGPTGSPNEGLTTPTE